MFLIKLISYLKKVKGIYTARPRVIKIGDGEVILKNLPKEKADEIASLLTGETKEEPVVANTDGVVSNDTTNYNLPLEDTALGLRKDNAGNWQLIVVKYNAESKQAVVETVNDYGRERQIAAGDFKVKVARLFLL